MVLKRRYVITAVMAVLAMAVVVILLKPAKTARPQQQNNKSSIQRKGLPRGNKPSTSLTNIFETMQPKGSMGADDGSDVGLYDDLPPHDRKLAESVRKALDDEDFSATLKAATAALKSTNTRVRLDAVEALGWFGQKSLADLTPCMADPDEDVSRAAINQWDLALSEMEKSADRFNVSFLALKTISDKDALKTIGSQFANSATDLIDSLDDEEKASAKRVEVVQMVVDLIDDEHPARSNAAREIYEEITGHHWISVEEAERYLANPTTYEVPEDSENGMSNTAEADSDNVEMGTNMAEADTSTAEAGSNKAEADTGMTEADTGTVQVDTNAAETDSGSENGTEVSDTPPAESASKQVTSDESESEGTP